MRRCNRTPCPLCRELFRQPAPSPVVDYLKDFGNAEQWDAGTQRCTRIGRAIDQGASWPQRTVGEEEMIGTILSALIGSFVGTWVTYQLGYSNSNGGREILGIIIAIVLIAI